MSAKKLVLQFLKGSATSGHYGHRGRPGKHGGSLPGGGVHARHTPETRARSKKGLLSVFELNPGMKGKFRGVEYGLDWNVEVDASGKILTARIIKPKYLQQRDKAKEGRAYRFYKNDEGKWTNRDGSAQLRINTSAKLIDFEGTRK